MKTCRTCENNFIDTYFYTRSPHCKKCFYEKKRIVEKKNPERTRRYKREGRNRYRKQHPEMRFGRINWKPEHYEIWKINYKVYKAKLKKGKCIECGDENVHAHHPDYSKPLDVIWLCPLHHKHVHQGRVFRSLKTD